MGRPGSIQEHLHVTKVTGPQVTNKRRERNNCGEIYGHKTAKIRAHLATTWPQSFGKRGIGVCPDACVLSSEVRTTALCDNSEDEDAGDESKLASDKVSHSDSNSFHTH